MSDWTKAKHNSELPNSVAEEIIKEYRNEIIIPHQKPKQQFLLCPAGLVGSGKTTVLIPLAEKLSLVRVSSDEIRQRLKKAGFNYDRAKELTIRMARAFIENGYSVAFDMNCGSQASKKYIADIEKEYKLAVMWIHINPPEDFVINKLKNYPHTWLFRNGDEAVEGYYKYKEAYGDFGSINFVCSIDPSRNDLSKQIDDAVKIINSKLSIFSTI